MCESFITKGTTVESGKVPNLKKAPKTLTGPLYRLIEQTYAYVLDELVDRSDALISEPKQKFDYVLANPPFGKKSSMTITNEEGKKDKDALRSWGEGQCGVLRLET